MSGIDIRAMNLCTRVFTEVDRLEQDLAQSIISTLEEELEMEGRASLLLSGGSTPLNLYARLSHFDIDWEKVMVGLVDERYVSVDSSQSNERLIKEALIQNKATKVRFVGLIYDENDLLRNIDLATDFNKEFYTNNTCVLLGMGTDGHTASLFPNDEHSLIGLFEDNHETPLVVTNSPAKPTQRISFTRDCLLNTKRLFLYFKGDEKMKVFTQAKAYHEPKRFPISAFIHQEEQLLEVFWTY